MVPVSRKSERIKINIRVSMSDEIARCLGLGRQVVPDLDQRQRELHRCLLARCAERRDYCNAVP
jgi:hypothetical protein